VYFTILSFGKELGKVNKFMKFGKVFFVGVFASAFLLALFVFKGNLLVKRDFPSFIAPLPSYLVDSVLVKSLDFWKPKEENVLQAAIAKPQIQAEAALIYDITDDKVLFEKNAKTRLRIASLVKIATAIVALESKEANSKFTVSEKAASVGENSMGISGGETYTLEELLYGLILQSGNDAAQAIAEGVSGNSDSFVSEMNRKAKILGLKDTFFINPSGLEEDDKEEYSSAFDLLALTKYALTIPLFAKVAQTVEYQIPYSQDHKYIPLYNQTNLLTSYPGVLGVKTGYTPSAGLCLVTYAENGGHKLIGIILNSPSRREEMRELLDYSFAVLGVKIPGRN